MFVLIAVMLGSLTVLFIGRFFFLDHMAVYAALMHTVHKITKHTICAVLDVYVGSQGVILGKLSEGTRRSVTHSEHRSGLKSSRSVSSLGGGASEGWWNGFCTNQGRTTQERYRPA